MAGLRAAMYNVMAPATVKISHKVLPAPLGDGVSYGYVQMEICSLVI